MVTEEALQRWLDRARPGDRLTYHRGHLARDRAAACWRHFQNPSAPPEQDTCACSTCDARRELSAVADLAWLAAEDGAVHLLQRRHGPDNYAYIAVRARWRCGGVAKR